jgi:hypothetical protein
VYHGSNISLLLYGNNLLDNSLPLPLYDANRDKTKDVKNNQNNHGLGYTVGSPFNHPVEGMWQWNQAGQLDAKDTPVYHINSEAEWDRITALNTANNSNETADESTAYLIKNGNQHALAVRSVNSKEELEQLLAYQQELREQIIVRQQQERDNAGNKRSAGLEITRKEQYQQRQKLEEQVIPTFAHFGMVTSGTHQQSYSEQFNEQLGGDQHRFYPDIVLASQPSIHQFSHGSGGAGGNGQFSHGSGGSQEKAWKERGQKKSQKKLERDRKRQAQWSSTI